MGKPYTLQTAKSIILQTVLSSYSQYPEAVREAARTYYLRKHRLEHPQMFWDNAKRAYPEDDEWCECCDTIRPPSRAYPYSLMKHCRSVEHVAHLHGVPEQQKAIRQVANIWEKVHGVDYDDDEGHRLAVSEKVLETAVHRIWFGQKTPNRHLDVLRLVVDDIREHLRRRKMIRHVSRVPGISDITRPASRRTAAPAREGSTKPPVVFREFGFQLCRRDGGPAMARDGYDGRVVIAPADEKTLPLSRQFDVVLYDAVGARSELGHVDATSGPASLRAQLEEILPLEFLPG